MGEQAIIGVPEPLKTPTLIAINEGDHRIDLNRTLDKILDLILEAIQEVDHGIETDQIVEIETQTGHGQEEEAVKEVGPDNEVTLETELKTSTENLGQLQETVTTKNLTELGQTLVKIGVVGREHLSIATENITCIMNIEVTREIVNKINLDQHLEKENLQQVLLHK